MKCRKVNWIEMWEGHDISFGAICGDVCMRVYSDNFYVSLISSKISIHVPGKHKDHEYEEGKLLAENVYRRICKMMEVK